MLPSRKLNKSKRVKRKEADLMGFKLIINNQGQFICELKTFPVDKIPLFFKKKGCQSPGVVIFFLVILDELVERLFFHFAIFDVFNLICILGEGATSFYGYFVFFHFFIFSRFLIF